ncbi:MAG TPA: transposase [Steroidobacteraceae bacterium]|nr:transposase [Steroidobacteraceae bacterium]
MTTESKRRRQERSPELKAQVLAECERPGASVAQVALAHGVNANLVHGWRRIERDRRLAASQALEEVKVISSSPAEAASFVPVTVEQTVSEGNIEIEVRRGALTMKATWPMAAATQCAAWAREILR